MPANPFALNLKVLLLGAVLVLSGCYTRQNQDNQDPETASAPSNREGQPGEAGPGTTPANRAPQKVNVNVYLEISNGMKGFMPPPAAGKEPTVFQRHLNQVMSEVQDGRYVGQKGFYLAKQDQQGRPVLDSVSYNTFKTTVVSGIQSNVLGTPLPAMLQAALEKSVAQGAVSVIISDFIHGPDPRDPGQFISLDSDIRSSLKLADQQDLAIAVLADASPFHGTYHPAVKKPEVRRTLSGEEIPFYIWVIGPQQEVQVVTNQVFRNLPAQQAYFGFSYPIIPFSAILKNRTFQPSGTVYCTSRTADPCTSVNLQPGRNEPVEFTVGLDLSGLPAAMQQEDYLQRNLRVTATGGSANMATVTAADAAARATPDLARYTHFVRVQVPQLTANSGAISMQLAQVYPAWVKAWATDNDNNPTAAPKKTYQFDKIIDGVQALYRDQSESVFNVTLNFNKAN
jgi:hypothetical protein